MDDSQSSLIESQQPKKTRSDEINEEIVKMLARTNNPFIFVEDKFFKQTVEKAYPGFTLNGRQFFASVVLPNVANELITNLHKKVSNNPFAITTDGWSSQNKPSPSFYR